MTLIDSDSNTDNRINPTLNAPDGVATRMAHNTYGNTYRREENNQAPRMVFKNALIITYDVDNKASSVYGYLPEVSDIPVLIIAQAGYDVFEDILEITPPTV